MHAILAIALLTNYDMIGETCSSPYDMIGSVEKGVIREVSDRTVVVYLDLDDAKTIQRIRKDCREIEGLRFIFDSADRVPAEGRGKKLPLLHYHTDSGWKFLSGWSGAFEFAQRWSTSNTGTEVRVENQGQPIRSSSTDNQGAVAHYPVRGSWWTGCGSWQHMTQGEHRGKFDANWLKSLSWSELQSLHSDDHEHRVQWSYVNKPSTAAAAGNAGKPTARRGFLQTWFNTAPKYCPNGNCPQ